MTPSVVVNAIGGPRRILVNPKPYCWVVVRAFTLRYHNEETILFTIVPHYGNLNNKIP